MKVSGSRLRRFGGPSLLAIGVLSWGAPSFAQSETEAPPTAEAPEAKTTSTATVAPAEPLEGDRPESGPGSLISESEFEPSRPPTAAEIDAAQSFEQQLELLQRELAYYEQGASGFYADQTELIRVKYQQQKDRLAQQYERRIEVLEDEERGRRGEAIERFEAFLRKYPNDAVYTPDAMFRLAELYYEKSYDDFLRESRGYEDELLAWERGERSGEPSPPEQRFDKTVGLHRELLQRFPDYRLADAAQYLLGYTTGEMGQTDEALVAYETLVRDHPNSKFVPEAWTRIGEIYFDGNTRTSLESAIAAYQNVLDFKDSPFYDKALYKVAWTHYRLDQFDDSVESFIKLVRFADAQKATTGVTGSELREEAIQYVAISLADELWGGFDKATAKLGPIENEDFTRELWKRYGEVLFEQTRYQDAIRVLAFTLDKYPNAPSNPEAQAQIVQAYEQLRDFDGATVAREKLVAQYGEGSDWAKKNSSDDAALAQAASLTERSLSTAALFRHQQAQVLRSQGKSTQSRSQYAAAAAAYEDYLSRFPDSANAYDFNFYLAETLYYSDDYGKAASQYAKVRDSAVDNKHLEPAALFSVIALEKEIEGLEKSGKLSRLAVLTAAERKNKAVSPANLPDARQSLVAASDRFVELVPSSENVPAIAYRAAEEYYKHDQFDEARTRFERIVANYPSEKVAEYSANLIIESYLAVEDWDKVDEWSGRLIEVAQRGKGGDTSRGDLVDNLEDVRLKAQFKIAERYNEAKQFEEAAEAYVKLVDANPKSEVADKALFNAAVAYERVKRFDTASQIYQRIYDDYPGSDLAPRSLFRVGINAAKGFEFEAAITAYNRLVQKYPSSDDRADALYNVAVVLEHMQRYKEAADAYRRYATTFRSRPDAGEVFFRSALVYEKLEDWGSVVQTLEAFSRAYASAPQQRERIVQARLKIGEAEEKRNRGRAARAAYTKCVSDFNRLRLNVSSKAGGFAARCAFELAEFEFDTYDSLDLAGNEKQQVAKLRRKLQAQQAVEKAYVDVFRYKRLEQTLAASYRIGHSYERLAESLFTAPVPKELRRDPDLADEYKAQLEDRAAVLERKAEEAYQKAYEEARRSGVTNQWTARILEGLNKFNPSEYPLQKAGKPALQTDFISGNGLDGLGVSAPGAPSSSRSSGASGATARATTGTPGGVRFRRGD